MKRYKCECDYVIFPFGEGAPVCIRERMIIKDHTKPLRQCTEKGCKHYMKYGKTVFVLKEGDTT